MASINRKTFLKNMLLSGLAVSGVPKISFGHTGKCFAFVQKTAEPDERKGLNACAIIDMHCHPSLGMYMSNKHFWRRHYPIAGENLLHMQLDLHQMRFGNIRGIVAAHYLPEAGIKREWATVKRYYLILNKLFSRLLKKIENEDPTNFCQIQEMMCILEEQLTTTNKKQTDIKFVIAKSFAEFKTAIDAGQSNNKTWTIPVAHAIEGAHALGDVKGC